MIPAHMEGDFSPEWYVESVCRNCEQTIYRYEMDVIVEWRHTNHSARCFHSPVAEPVVDIPRGTRGDG